MTVGAQPLRSRDSSKGRLDGLGQSAPYRMPGNSRSFTHPQKSGSCAPEQVVEPPDVAPWLQSYQLGFRHTNVGRESIATLDALFR